MSDQSDRLKRRTMSFAINVLHLVDRFPRTVSADVVARQLAKCSTSVAANYRAVCNAKSRPDFIAKLATVVEEADESVFWLEIVTAAPIVSGAEPLLDEAIQLRAIFGKSLGTARANSRRLRES